MPETLITILNYQNMSNTISILRPTLESDLEVFFNIQLEQEGIFMAAFTSADPSNKVAYMDKWKRLLADPTINIRTILYNNEIAGSVSKYEIGGDAEITYWIGKKFWGLGIASESLKEFLTIEKKRPIWGRVAFDNIGSKRVLEKNGFVQIGTDRGFANARGMEIEEFIFKLM